MAGGSQPNRTVLVKGDRRTAEEKIPPDPASGPTDSPPPRPPAGRSTGEGDDGGRNDNEPPEAKAPGELAYDLLVKAITEVPLPGAPPHGQQHGAEIGLAFVDGALRQNHVRRISETLHLVEHGAALLTVRADLSLSLLNDGQYRAGKAYSGLRGMNNGVHTLTRPESEDTLVWVPVTRLSRRRVSPVDVRDARGEQVPRLTQDETGQLMAPAMYRLLRSILESEPDATRPETDLDRFLRWDDQARWVLQRALIALTTERANPTVPTTRPVASKDLDAEGVAARLLAIKVLRDNRHSLTEYFQLLEIVVSDYFVIVGLSDDEDEHTLTYKSPLEANRPGDRNWRERLGDRARVLRDAGNAYDVEYSSNLSTGVRSYHFAAVTELELSIEPPYLTTSFDRERTKRLADDMTFLADQIDVRRTQPGHHERILGLEVCSVMGRLGEILRRRHWEADQVELGLPETTAPSCHELRRMSLDPANVTDPLDCDHPEATSKLLREAVEELDTYELGTDISAEKDPPSSQAHAYWRKPLEGHTTSLTTIDVRCNLRITDSTDGGPRNVGLFVAGVALLNLLIAALLFGRMWPFDWKWGTAAPDTEVTQNADALVGVLLLVPGFIYTRLRLPAPGTIAGRLRRYTRSLAYVVILSSAVLGITVAAGTAPKTVEWVIWGSIGIDLICCLLLLRDRRDRPSLPTPAWARQPAQRHRKPRRPDAVFNGVGLPDHL